MYNPDKLATLGTQGTGQRQKIKHTQKTKEVSNSKMLEITMRKHIQKTQ
jgi:hypothetical protein